VIDAVTRSSSLVLAAVLGLAVAHKLRVLRAGAAHEQPLIRRREWSPEVAAVVLMAAACMEAAVAVFLVLRPPVGLIALAGLLLAYTRELRRLDAGESCGCLGEFLDRADRAQAVRRNLILVGVAMAAAAAYLSGAAAVADLTQLEIGLTALVLAVIVARAALARQFKTGEEQLGGAS
jgi:hypothetical protein